MGLIITLILVGLILILAEILLIPGVGVAGILGLLSMGGSCAYAFMEFGNQTGAIVTAVNAVLLVAFIVWVLRAKTWKRLALDTNIDAKAVVPEVKVAPGDRGKATTRLAPMGMARFGDSTLEVTALEGIIDSGAGIEVSHIDDNKIFVKQLN